MQKSFLILLLVLFIGCKSPSILVNEFYNSKELKSVGAYKLKEIEDCGSGEIEVYNYKFRVGKWKFYHPNGTLKAEVDYEEIKSNIETRCTQNQEIIFSKIKDNLKYFDLDGNQVIPNKLDLTEFNCVTQYKDNFVIIEYCYNPDKNIVKHEIKHL